MAIYVNHCKPIFFLFIFLCTYICNMIHWTLTANSGESAGSMSYWLKPCPVYIN